MSSNCHKNTICNVYGIVMRDDLLKRHMNSKHSNISRTQHNDEVKAEDSEIEELDYKPLTHDAKLEFELQRDNEGAPDWVSRDAE